MMAWDDTGDSFCDECNAYTFRLVEFEVVDVPPGHNASVLLCVDCLKVAIKMVEEKHGVNTE